MILLSIVILYWWVATDCDFVNPLSSPHGDVMLTVIIMGSALTTWYRAVYLGVYGDTRYRFHGPVSLSRDEGSPKRLRKMDIPGLCDISVIKLAILPPIMLCGNVYLLESFYCILEIYSQFLLKTVPIMKAKGAVYITQEDDDFPVDVEKAYSVPEISDLAMMELQMVARESITFVGGPAAILLQIAHPLVGAGVADHSTFRTRAISRAEYTQMYIYCMIFGSTSEKAAMKAYVDKAHSRVVGQHNKQSYDAKDPELQVWVAATIYATMVNMYELIYGPLNSTRAERVYRAFSIMGTSLQVPPGMWPENLTEFQLYWDDMVNKRLCVTPNARAVLHDIFHPAKGLPLWARPLAVIAMPFVKRLTIEQLPPRVRDQFLLKSTKSSRAISGLFVSGMSGVYPFMPLFLRQFTKTYMMGQMRRRIKKRGGQLVKP